MLSFSDDEIQVEQKIKKMKPKAPKRTRKTSAPPNNAVPTTNEVKKENVEKEKTMKR